jgi:hypothetical protein
MVRKKYAKGSVEFLFFNRAGGKCEGCGKIISWEKRGPSHRREEEGWEIHHLPDYSLLEKNIIRVDPNQYPFLTVLCWDPCHKKTLKNQRTPINFYKKIRFGDL